MSNAFMIMSFLLLLALFQSLELNRRLQSATPIVIDEKSGNFKFKSGSAELTPDFKKYINNKIIPQIEKIIEEREIDFIQVIGHTDGQVLELTGNLDQNLEKVAKNELKVTQLNPGSNADLALMRALGVVQELQAQGQFKNVKFRAYSGAQLYLPSGELAPLNRQADEVRRRIEIRFIPPATHN
ncbi:MAG: OmpA family protein [Geminocystis sp. GBBB08]|nr:OmpA family protein [Geminocystis sp. GBBB08]